MNGENVGGKSEVTSICSTGCSIMFLIRESSISKSLLPRVVIERATDKAINAARSLQTAIDYSLNKHLKAKVNGKVIECGIGIDYGKVLVTQVGMYGVELFLRNRPPCA